MGNPLSQDLASLKIQRDVDPDRKGPGRIARITVKEGSVVKAGEVLAEIEDADQKSQIAWADARAAAALARAEASRANIAELTQQIAREKELVEKGVSGSANLGDMILRQKALEQSARAGDAEVRAARSEVTSLRVLLKDRTIVAPIDGTVLTKPPEVGELIGPQAPLVEIADFRSLVVETDVPEARLNLVKVGAPCEIVLDAYPSKRYRGSAIELGMGRFLEENMGSMFPYFRIEPSTMVMAVFLTVGLSTIAAIFPAYQASKLSVTDALRRVA